MFALVNTDSETKMSDLLSILRSGMARNISPSSVYADCRCVLLVLGTLSLTTSLQSSISENDMNCILTYEQSVDAGERTLISCSIRLAFFELHVVIQISGNSHGNSRVVRQLYRKTYLRTHSYV